MILSASGGCQLGAASVYVASSAGGVVENV